MRSLTSWTILGGVLLGWTSVAGAAGAATDSAFAPAVTRADVDLANCRAASDGKAVAPAAPAAADVMGVLGLDSQRRGWSGGSVSGENAQPRTFQYVVAFNRPVSIGSILLRGTVQAVAFLKADAPYPPALPAAEGAWQTGAIPPNQSGARLVTFPPGVQTRAILLTDRCTHGGSRIDSMRCLAGRLRNGRACPRPTRWRRRV
jgi:hypothetical protein